MIDDEDLKGMEYEIFTVIESKRKKFLRKKGEKYNEEIITMITDVATTLIATDIVLSSNPPNKSIECFTSIVRKIETGLKNKDKVDK